MVKSNSVLAVAALAIGVIALPGTAQAQAQAYSAERQISTFDEAILSATLTDLGATWKTSTNEQGSNVYEVTFDTGLMAFMYFRACDDSNANCTGLVMAAAFTKPEGMDAATLDGKLRTFNDSYPAGKAFIGSDGDPLIQWYAMSDGGITMANLRTQLSVFSDVGSEFSNALYD